MVWPTIQMDLFRRDDVVEEKLKLTLGIRYIPTGMDLDDPILNREFRESDWSSG